MYEHGYSSNTRRTSVISSVAAFAAQQRHQLPAPRRLTAAAFEAPLTLHPQLGSRWLRLGLTPHVFQDLVGG